MGKLFEGNVKIQLSGKGDLRLKKDPNGVFNKDTASELYAKALELEGQHKALCKKYNVKPADTALHSYSFFFPLGRYQMVKGKKQGLVPVLGTDKFGNPRLTLLPPLEKKFTSKSSTIDLA